MRPIQYLKPAARVFLGALKPNKHARHGSPVPDNGHKGSDDRGGRAGGPPGSPNRGSTNGPTNTRRVTGRARTRQGRSRPTGRTDGDRKNPPTADKHNQTAAGAPGPLGCSTCPRPDEVWGGQKRGTSPVPCRPQATRDRQEVARRGAAAAAGAQPPSSQYVPGNRLGGGTTTHPQGE